MSNPFQGVLTGPTSSRSSGGGSSFQGVLVKSGRSNYNPSYKPPKQKNTQSSTPAPSPPPAVHRTGLAAFLHGIESAPSAVVHTAEHPTSAIKIALSSPIGFAKDFNAKLIQPDIKGIKQIAANPRADVNTIIHGKPETNKQARIYKQHVQSGHITKNTAAQLGNPYINPDRTKQVNTMLAKGASDKQISSFLSSKTKDDNAVANKMLAEAVGTASLAVGGEGVAKDIAGEAANSLKSKVVSKIVGNPKVTASFGVGNAASTVQDNPNATSSQIIKSGLEGAAAGRIFDVIPRAAGVAIKASDKAAGKTVEKALSKTPLAEGAGLPQIGSKGLVGSLDKAVSRGGKNVVYKASDLLQKTRTGSRLVNFKDKVLTNFIDPHSVVIKDLKRAGHDRGVGNALVNEFRMARGNVTRATAEADHSLENNKNFKNLRDELQNHASQGDNNIIHSKDAFDEYAKAKTQSDLIKAGKTKATPRQAAIVEKRLAAATKANPEFEKTYQHLPKIYSDLLDLKLKHGSINQETYDRLKNEKFDYVRIQRDLPEWAQGKPNYARGGAGAGKVGVQKRNAFAHGEIKSPTETLIRAYQAEFHNAAADKQNRTLHKLLEPEGGSKLVRSTSDVEQKRALIRAMAESKPIVTKLNKSLRLDKTHALILKKEVTQLNRQGRNSAAKELNKYIRDFKTAAGHKPDSPFSVSDITKTLMTLDTKELRKFRRMIEHRNGKLSPLLDKIELAQRDLHDIQQARKAQWEEAQGIHTDPHQSKIPNIQFMDKGEKNVARVDPHIAAAMNGWNNKYQDAVVNHLRFANNIFKYGTTVANPAFPLRNLTKDLPFGFVNSPKGFSVVMPSNLVRGIASSAGVKLSKEDTRLFDEYQKGNKNALTVNQYTKPKSARQMANEVVTSGASKGQKVFTYAKNPRAGARLLQADMDKLIGIAETSGRFQQFRATYKRAIKEGYAEPDALRIAHLNSRDNTIDFSVMGDYVHGLNALFPYFNAPIQGVRTVLRSAADRPVSTAAKLAAVSTLPETTTTIWNMSDPKRKAIYDSIPDYQKSSHFVIISPSGRVFMIPKSQELDAAGNTARKATEYLMNNPDHAKSLGDWLKKDAGSMLSNDVQDVSPLTISGFKRTVGSFTPQLLKPSVEAAYNVDSYTGNKIVPDYKYQGKPVNQQYDPNNYSQFSVDLAKRFPGLSPLQIDHFIKGTFGQVGQQTQNTIDRILTKNPKGHGGLSIGESVARSFVGKAGGADTQSFYNIYKPLQDRRAYYTKQITAAKKNGEIGRASRLANEYNDSIRGKFDTFHKTYKQSPSYDPSWDDKINKLRIKPANLPF